MSADGIVILGGGMAGFGAAHALHGAGVRARLYDERAQRGGHTSSYAFDDGFIFDDGPHISFTDNTRFQELLADSVGGAFERIRAYVNNYWQGHWIKHPAHANLYGLPADLIIKCVKELVETSQAPAPAIHNYQDWLVAAYGPTFANTFPGEYTKKYHTTEARNLTTDWLGPRLYRGDLEQVLRGALEPETPELHYIDKFRYPTRGGFVSYLDKFLPMADQHYGHRVTAIDMQARALTFANGAATRFDRLISSVPLPALLPLIKGAPADVVEKARKLAVTRTVIVNIGLRRTNISRAHWTYFYDADICFSRLSFPHLFSPHVAPDGCGSIQAEVYFSDKYKPLEGSHADWIEPVIADLIRCGLVREGEEIVHRSSWLTSGNVIFDHDRPKGLADVHGYLEDIGIAYCGRYGDWGYMWTDESFVSGERAAQKVIG
ncbi:MAG: NAD(P)-binding protein [Hyphomonadaceae bacterium]|nr:NAD(P)-binding protein [Hyphomonadaceae bacterium]